MLVAHVQAGFAEADFLAALERVLAGYARVGVTSLHNSTTTRPGFGAYQRLHAAGRLKTRIGVVARGHEEEFRRGLRDAHVRDGFGDDWLRLIGVEWVADGAASARTAACHTPCQPPAPAGEPPETGAGC